VPVRNSFITMSLAAAVILCFAASNAGANNIQTFNAANGGRSAWETAVGHSFVDVDISGPVDTCNVGPNAPDCDVTQIITPAGKTLTLGDGLVDGLSFHRQKVPDGRWATWSGGNQPFVIANFSLDQLKITLAPGQDLPSFGFEMEPDFGTLDMRVILSDGTVIANTGPNAVNSDSGAAFFGWTNGDNITSFTMQCGDPSIGNCFNVDANGNSLGFAFGRLVEAVPEPTSLPLFAGALIGFALVVRRRNQSASAVRR